MASYGLGESPPRGSWGYGDHDTDARPRRKRPFPEEEGEEGGWRGVAPPSWSPSERRGSREKSRAAPGREGRTGRGGPWPERRGEEGEEGEVRGRGRSRSPWGTPRREPSWEESLPARESTRGRGRSRSPPRESGPGWRGSSPSGSRERAWRSPVSSRGPSSLAPHRRHSPLSRSSSSSSRRSSSSRGREGGRSGWERRGSRASRKGRAREAMHPKSHRWKSPQEVKRRRYPSSPGQKPLPASHMERSSSSTSSFRSRGPPGGEARQDRGQERNFREKDRHSRKRGRSAERRRASKGSQGGFPIFPGEEGGWRSPSRERGKGGSTRNQRSPGGPVSKRGWGDSPSSSPQSQLGWDQGGSCKGSMCKAWTGSEGLEMPQSSNEDLEDSEGSTGFLEEWGLLEGQVVTESLQEGGPPSRPKIYMEPEKHAAAPVTWVPREAVVDFWNQCQSVMKKRVQDYLMFTCPRPTLPDQSCEIPKLNPSVRALLTPKEVKVESAASYYLRSLHEEVLNAVAPVMTIYEMAEEAIEKKEAVDPLELREWSRRILRYMGSISQRLLQQRCSHVLGRINPTLKSMTTKMSGSSGTGLLFAEDKVEFLKEIILRFPELDGEPRTTSMRNDYAARRRKVADRRPDFVKFGAHPWVSGAQQERISAHQSNAAEAPREEVVSLALWHRRFAHRDSETILKLHRRRHATCLEVKESDASSAAGCAVCLKVKGPRPSSPPGTKRRSSEVLELIHTDVHGPMSVPSLGNNRYILIFVDDFSRYRFIFLLRKKTEIHYLLKKYVSIVRNKFNRKPKAFQIDNKDEYFWPHIKAVLEEEGILCEEGVADAPEQSRMARWGLRSLLEMTKCMLADAELPNKFWGDAIMTAVHLLNILPTEDAKETPFELWNGCVPNLNRIRVFGSLAHAYVPLLERSHLDPKREETILLGFTSRLNCYKVMNLRTGEVSTRTVDFIDEEKKVDKKGTVLEASGEEEHDIDCLFPPADKAGKLACVVPVEDSDFLELGGGISPPK
uniref:Integrase catalytic domain-containing protein n=1 Tax=Pogona vitticeps TaxID=103695 RepID=A0A6J0SSI8_9SAUR